MMNGGRTMIGKYKDKYRIQSARLQNWDYGRNAAYFVTICTKNSEFCLGNIVNADMHLSKTGELAYQIWYEIPSHFPFVLLDAFVVMPNHVHGIVVIDKTDNCNDGGGCDDVGDAINRVFTGGVTGVKNPMMHWNLSRIIRWYKGRVSFESRTINPVFSWQPRFHDHIIRNRKSLETVQAYVMHNPAKWPEDTYYKK